MKLWIYQRADPGTTGFWIPPKPEEEEADDVTCFLAALLSVRKRCYLLPSWSPLCLYTTIILYLNIFTPLPHLRSHQKPEKEADDVTCFLASLLSVCRRCYLLPGWSPPLLSTIIFLCLNIFTPLFLISKFTYWAQICLRTRMLLKRMTKRKTILKLACEQECCLQGLQKGRWPLDSLAINVLQSLSFMSQPC